MYSSSVVVSCGSFCCGASIDGRLVKADIPPTLTTATDATARTEPLNISKPRSTPAGTRHSLTSSPADSDSDSVTAAVSGQCDNVAGAVSGQCDSVAGAVSGQCDSVAGVGGGQSRQSYASVVSPPRHDSAAAAADVELPCPGQCLTGWTTFLWRNLVNFMLSLHFPTKTDACWQHSFCMAQLLQAPISLSA